MTASVGVGAVPRAGRWSRRLRRAAASAAVAVAGTVGGLAGGIPAAADETVRLDGDDDADEISVLGDSTLAGVRWYGDYGPLQRFDVVFNAESCRRTIERSCVSREGYRSKNVVATMQDLDGELGRVLVVMSGYNDPIGTIDEAIAAVVDEARSQGVEHVVWLSLRTSQDVDYSDPQHQSSINTFREYNEQLVAAAAASGGFLQVADWATYSTGSSAWFEHDGVHLTRAGVDAVTTFIADAVTQVAAGGNVSPAVAPWSVLVPGAEGERVTAVQQALLAAGIAVPGGADGVYGNDTMIAVAQYQRDRPELRETGAVDIATATALGVYADPDAVPPTTAAASPTTVTAAPTTVPAVAVAAADPRSSAAGSRTWVLIAIGIGVVSLTIASALVARRRHVIARRSARRWARVHPSTAPGRSIADLRRSGELPAIPVTRVYDHTLEGLPAIADTGELPVS